jgi:hypothetical protein
MKVQSCTCTLFHVPMQKFMSNVHFQKEKKPFTFVSSCRIPNTWFWSPLSSLVARCLDFKVDQLKSVVSTKRCAGSDKSELKLSTSFAHAYISACQIKCWPSASVCERAPGLSTQQRTMAIPWENKRNTCSIHFHMTVHCQNKMLCVSFVWFLPILFPQRITNFWG